MLKRNLNFLILIFLLTFMSFSSGFAEENAKYTKLSDFDGKLIAVPTGTVHDEIVRETLPSAEILYFETDADNVGAILSGRAEAHANDEEVLKNIVKENNNLAIFDGYLKEVEYSLIFARTPRCEKIRIEFNEYLKRIKSDGTLQQINNIWFGEDESLKELPEFENYPDINGTVKIAVNNEVPPFDYVKDRRVAGYEPDIILRFCKEKGYKPVFVIGNFGSIIPSVISGKCDIGMSFLTVTEERAKIINFSEPIYTGGTRLLVLKNKIADTGKDYSNLSELAGKRIGVTTGTTHPQIAAKYVPTAELVYFENSIDTLLALKTGKIDAACTGIPLLKNMMAEDASIIPFGEQLTFTEGAPIFPKNDKGKKLCEQFSEFAKACWDNGTIKELEAFWLEQKESKRIMKDYSNLPAPNGVLKMAVNEASPPFIYVKDNRIVGYDIDFVFRFCEAYGYGLKIIPMKFSGIIPAVISGKCDLGIGAITITEERKESVLFSYPNIKTGNIFAVRKNNIEKNNIKNKKEINSLSDLSGLKVGIILGANHDIFAAEKIPNVKIEYFNDLSAVTLALKAGKIDAFANTLPTAIYMTHEHKDISYISEPLENTYTYSAFTDSEKGRKICREYAEFIKSLWEDGTIKKLSDKWIYSEDESRRTIEDYSKLPATNGTLKMAIDTGRMPFAYVKDNRITGYDIELATMFCKSHGYGFEVYSMDFTGILGSIKTGKCDLTGSITKTEEREETMLFSPVPNAETPIVLLIMKSGNVLLNSNSKLSELSGKRIGVTTGTTHPQIAAKYVPTAKLVYFENSLDTVLALKTGKIDALCATIPFLKNMMAEDDSIIPFGEQLTFIECAPIFPKNDKGKKLCEQFSEFAKACWDNGTIKELEAFWFEQKESKRIMKDYSNLPAPNGVLKIAVSDESMPFVYVKDNRIVGYDIDFAFRFCEAYGYGLEIIPMNFKGIIPAVISSKCDLGIGEITITEERKESVLFSYPNMRTGNIFAVKANKIDFTQATSPNKKSEGPEFVGISQFEGKEIGAMMGSLTLEVVKEAIPSANIFNFNIPSDMLVALKTGKVDAIALTSNLARYFKLDNPDIEILPYKLSSVDNAPVFPKTEKGKELCKEYGDFVKKLWDDGTMKEIDSIWFGADESKKILEDYSELPSPKGTLTMAADPAIIPFVYIKDNKITGYDVDIAIRFCKSHGYGLKIEPMSASAIIPALKSEKYDYASCSISRTKEREESVLFSYPTAWSEIVLVVMKNNKIASAAEKISEPSKIKLFFDDLSASFERTFIREERYKLFLEGIINTMIITVLSILFGMILGFSVFMLCRTGNIFANIITKISVWLIKGTPSVVLLMILYYVIFGHVNINGIFVAIIAFTLTFGAAVYRMLTFGTGAIDKGQTEAAYALGYTDLQTFFTIILPQAALHFMPSFKEEVTVLIKSTAVVGYIAVQDLTKMGDIVRSRTYEAFFPLIAVAIIYFILAGLLNIIVLRIHWKITPSKRKPEDILKGINLNSN